VNEILATWDGFSVAQKVAACVTITLAIGALLYMPYYVPTTDSCECSWAWKPVRCDTPEIKKIVGLVDVEKLRANGVSIDPNWKENSKERAGRGRG
jgi:hypothetical protein